ncbi:MAG: ArnT family glycosyltransferase, partial [Patescibacteria group bacterium]
MKRPPILVLSAILSLALFLRLYRISALTEFLGDQGRTGIHIYEAVMRQAWPLLGPTVLTGQHLGPAFYYLIGPAFILGGFDPVWPAVFMAVVGVGSIYLLWVLSQKIFGWQIASLLSLVYATSPNIVSQDRIIWEPNLIPFFGLLFVFSLYQIKEAKKLGYMLLLGVTLGILVQLHYPNIFFLGLTLLFFAYLLINQKKLKLVRVWWKRGAVGFLAYLLALSPFIYYEVTHNFVNLAGIARVMLLSLGTATSERSTLANFIDYAGRLIGGVVPLRSPWQIWF